MLIEAACNIGQLIMRLIRSLAQCISMYSCYTNNCPVYVDFDFVSMFPISLYVTCVALHSMFCWLSLHSCRQRASKTKAGVHPARSTAYASCSCFSAAAAGINADDHHSVNCSNSCNQRAWLTLIPDMLPQQMALHRHSKTVLGLLFLII